MRRTPTGSRQSTSRSLIPLQETLQALSHCSHASSVKQVQITTKSGVAHRLLGTDRATLPRGGSRAK
jgi:hypothetical protein